MAHLGISHRLCRDRIVARWQPIDSEPTPMTSYREHTDNCR